MSNLPPSVPQFNQPIVNQATGVSTQVWYQFFLLLRGRLNGGTLALNVTEVTHEMSPYTIQSADFWLACDSSGGPITILPPEDINDGLVSQAQLYLVKDVTGQAGTNPVMFGMVLDGQAGLGLTAPYDGRWIGSYNGSDWSFLT